MDEVTKMELYHELVERRIRMKDSSAMMSAIVAIVLLVVSACIVVTGVYSLTSATNAVEAIQSIAVMGGVATLLFGLAMLEAMLGVANYFDNLRWIDELNELYAEVIE